MTNEDAPDIAMVDRQPSSDPDGSGALLGLEPAPTENKQENADLIEQNDPVEAIFPLLGTSSLTR